jgi:hypothetical protein
MIKLHPKSVRLANDSNEIGVLRFSWAYTLTIEALHEMCTGEGGVLARLRAIDPEFLELKPEAFPEQNDVRTHFLRYKELAHHLEPRMQVGVPKKTSAGQALSEVHMELAQLLWDIHRDFSYFMQSDA